jgi:glycosyltransferase involved in cell wall biosynthesis
MIKVVHVVPTFMQGGVQTGILYSIKELRQEFDYKVLVIGNVDDFWLKNVPDDIRNNIIIVGSSNILLGSIKAFGVLRQIKPQIVISSLWKSVFLTSFYKIFNPKVCLCGFFHSSSSFHFVDLLLLRIIAKVEDIAFADSEATSKFIRDKFSVKNCKVVPYYFDFSNSTRKRKLDPTLIRIAYFGILYKVKGIERAIKFCKLCKEAGIRFQFDIYGSGEVAKYNKIIENYSLGNEVQIKYLLPLSEVRETMLQYDFLLQLSNFEGMALSVVEALSCGIIPLVTPVGEIKNYTKDGVNALWLEPEFDNNLVNLVNKLSNTIKNIEIYEQMSLSAADTFKNQKKYSDAFIEGINSYFDKKDHS